MNNWSDLLGTLGAAAKRTAGAVGTGVSIAAQEQKLREAYEAIGKLYFQHVRDGKPLTGEAFDTQIDRAYAALERINELRLKRDVTGPAEEDFE